MKAHEYLPSIFKDGRIVLLDAHALHVRKIPARTVRNGAGMRLDLHAMQERELHLRLDGTVYGFLEARGNVKYVESPTSPMTSCSDRVVAIRRVMSRHAPVLLLVDEQLGKTVAVIGVTLAWNLEGLDVRLVNGSDASLV